MSLALQFEILGYVALALLAFWLLWTCINFVLNYIRPRRVPRATVRLDPDSVGKIRCVDE